MSSADARPRPRAFWADVRFLLGIVLIIGSVAGVWAVVITARQTAPALAAARTLVPGEAISPDDLHVVDVALGAARGGYLSPDALEPGAVVTRTIERGELIARAAVGSADAARVTTVVLPVAGDVPVAVSAGTVVEVWAAPQLERGTYGTPRVLVASATVLSVTRGDTVMGGGETSLELVIARVDVSAALAALADGSRLSVVPLSGLLP
ncbi:SAF domain-containing protein [Microbacterium sp. PA5]|uniref:SAF domain-containing protein n=1 Tax=Microbacterium sp. PA5 TaxID=3416654 RepID=UPI003CEFBAE4